MSELASLSSDQIELVAILLRVSIIVLIIVLLVTRVFIIYAYFRAENAKGAAWAFVPIPPFYLIPIYNKIGKSKWNLVLWFIPPINFYIIIRDLLLFYKENGSKSGLVLVTSILIPFSIYFYMMYRIIKHIPYSGTSRRENGVDSRIKNITEYEVDEEPKIKNKKEPKVKNNKKSNEQEAPGIMDRANSFLGNHDDKLNNVLENDLVRGTGLPKNYLSEEEKNTKYEEMKRLTEFKDKILRKCFFEEGDNEYFVGKWLKSNLEVFAQSGFDYKSSHINIIKNDLLRAEITVSEIMNFVKNKNIRNDECESIFNKNTTNQNKEEILELYTVIFEELLTITVDQEDDKRHVLRVLQAMIELVKIEGVVDKEFYKSLLFDEDNLKNVSLIVNKNVSDFKKILINLYEN